MNSIALTLHILAVIVWIGGMFFMTVAVRPALSELDLEQRLRFITAVLKRFFPWVWASIIILILTGLWMVHQLGGWGSLPNSIYIMPGLGIIMLGVFKFILLAPFKHLQQSVESQNWKVAAFAMGTIRKLVLFNLGLGLVIVIVALAF